MPSVPLVSVVMPLRNGSRYLRLAIESILKQSCADLELIVIDDGSDDGTSDIIQPLMREDSRLRLIRQDSLGIVAALNTGIGEARAKLIGRMDADDIAAPRRFDLQIAALDGNPQAAAVGSAFIIIDSEGIEKRLVRYPCSPDDIRKHLPQGNCVAHPTILMRKDAVQQLGGYRRPFSRCEDYDLWLRMSEKHDIINLAEPLLYYRMHDEQCTWNEHEERILSELGAQACAGLRRAGLPEPPLPDNGPINLAFLERAGVSRAMIAHELVARSAGIAEYALGLGLTRAAYGAFLAAMKHDMPLKRRLSLAFRFLRQVLAAKVRR